MRAVAPELGSYQHSKRQPEGSFGLDYDMRAQRTSGGKVSYPAKRLSRMVKSVARAQRAIAEETRPIMEMPDWVVAYALQVAKSNQERAVTGFRSGKFPQAEY